LCTLAVTRQSTAVFFEVVKIGYESQHLLRNSAHQWRLRAICGSAL